MRREVIGNCELYLGDCMELMARYPDKYFDLAIVDPPYGLKRIENGTGHYAEKYCPQGKKWDMRPTKDYFDRLFQISKNQIIWGGNYFSLPPRRGWICWYKSDEIKNRTFSEFELAWTSIGSPARHFTEKPFIRGGERIHPTQKPISLYKWLLSKYAKPGWKILDTHFGSGSIAVACNELGFKLTASEIDPDYFEAACKRITEADKQRLLNLEGAA